jgi:hypothetical protein
MVTSFKTEKGHSNMNNKMSLTLYSEMHYGIALEGKDDTGSMALPI